MRYHERVVMLSVLDGLWKDHLLAMDHLKEGIGLRGYAQQDPLVAYKKESFDMFEAMMLRFQEDTSRNLFRMQILAPDGTPIETAEQLAALQSGGQQQQQLAAQQAAMQNSQQQQHMAMQELLAAAAMGQGTLPPASNYVPPAEQPAAAPAQPSPRARRPPPSTRSNASSKPASNASSPPRARPEARPQRHRLRHATQACRSVATTLAIAAPARSSRSATAQPHRLLQSVHRDGRFDHFGRPSFHVWLQPLKQQGGRSRPRYLRHHKPRHVARANARKRVRQAARQRHRRVRANDVDAVNQYAATM